MHCNSEHTKLILKGKNSSIKTKSSLYTSQEQVLS